jgi:hypothetical protein
MGFHISGTPDCQQTQNTRRPACEPSILIVVAIILNIAAVAMPNLLQSKMAADEEESWARFSHNLKAATSFLGQLWRACSLACQIPPALRVSRASPGDRNLLVATAGGT